LAPLDVGRIFGVGAVARSRLAALGIERIGDLQAMSEEQAAHKIGDQGRRLWRLARGEDVRSVHSHRATKNVSSEVTFENDISDFEELSRHLLSQAERLASRLRKDGLAAGSLSLKLRRKSFQLLTRTRPLPTPNALAPYFVRVLKPVLRSLADGAAFRLLGVIAADLSPLNAESDATLFTEVDRREGDREAAIDSIRERFGRGALVRGPLFKG
jgi:DNA polymerase IV